MGILIPFILVIICCIVIWRASDGFTTASDFIGRNLSEGVRGATINAVASSMPEVFTTMFFLFYLHDVNGFSGGIGATAGSAIFNGMIIPAFVILVVVLSGLAKKINISRKVYLRDGISLIVAELIFIILISGTTMRWYHGFILMLVYFAYVAYMFISMPKNGKNKEINHSDYIKDTASYGSFLRGALTFNFERMIIGKSSKMTSPMAWTLLLSATVAMVLICFLLVQACEWLGSDTYEIPYLGTFHGLDIPIIFVSVILAAAASSIPDTIISMKDAKKGNYDDAVSNALGSNIFDICFAMGFPLFLYTIVYGPISMTAEIIDLSAQLRMLLLILTIISIGIYIVGKGLGIFKALALLGLYALFSLFIIGISAGNEVSVAIGDFLEKLVYTLRIQ